MESSGDSFHLMDLAEELPPLSKSSKESIPQSLEGLADISNPFEKVSEPSESSDIIVSNEIE